MDEQCHHCDYELVGLPNRGTCPECGETYDKQSLYRSAKTKEPAFVRHIKSLTLAAFTVMVLVCGGLLSFKATNTLGAITLTLIVAGVSGFGAFAYWWVEREERRGAQ